MTDADLAARLAEAAGYILLAVRRAEIASAASLGRLGDHVANGFLVTALREARPDDGLLSEEMRCDGSRLGTSRVWIVDPLDGTREFGEGRDDWAVHVGLAIDGVASVGAVALPAAGVVLRSDRPIGPTPLGNPMRMVVSRTRPAPIIEAAAQRLGARLIPMGSAGAKAMAVVRGEADAYLHLGGQHEWDSAAPVAVAMAHGLHCSRLDGAPLRYNAADVYLPDLAICRPELWPRIRAALAANEATPVG